MNYASACGYDWRLKLQGLEPQCREPLALEGFARSKLRAWSGTLHFGASSSGVGPIGERLVWDAQSDDSHQMAHVES